MFFGKKEKADAKSNEKLLYYMYRDSLTGQMNRAYAVKEFEKLKKTRSGCVMVNTVNAGNMPMYKAEEAIRKAAQLICSVTECEVARIEEGYFVVFSTEYDRLAEKLFYFLSQFAYDDVFFAVGAKGFDCNEEDFDRFIGMLKRCTHAAEYSGYERIVRDLPIYSKNT